MTAIASLLSSAAAMPPPVPSGAATALSASFLDLLAPVACDTLPGERQADAAPGNALPLDDEATDHGADALAWLGVGAPPSLAMIAPDELPAAGADGSGVRATEPVAPIVSRVGGMQPSPVEPLVAPSGVPLSGSDGVASPAPNARTSQSSDGGDTPLPAPTASLVAPAGLPLPGSDASSVSRSGQDASPVTREEAYVAPHVGGATDDGIVAPDATATAMAAPVGAGFPTGETRTATGSVDQPFSLQPQIKLAGTPVSRRDALSPSVLQPWTRLDRRSVQGESDGRATREASSETISRVAALPLPAPIGRARFNQPFGEQAQTGTNLTETAATLNRAALPGVVRVPGAASLTGTLGGAAGFVVPPQAGAATVPAIASTSAGERPLPSVATVTPDAGATAAMRPVGEAAGDKQVERASPGAAAGLAPRVELMPAAAVAPAARVFAAAIHRALGEQDARQSSDPTPVLAPLTTTISGTTAMATVPGGALDTRHEHWPAAMIERIVSLRDMAAENDTRLRLSPDMLGTVDVSLKRDGDVVQVQITAEQAQTRQLLADAQPRLAELADARGVKLHLTGGQAGSGGQPDGDAPRHHPSPPSSTRRDAAAHDDAGSTEQRIA
jgi:flagellar hook-length control protein FliK